MTLKKLTLVALALIAGPMAANAQTYNLDITMTGVQGLPSVTFSGGFTFNASGTCTNSIVFCPAGTTPQLTNVNIRDPLSIDPPGGAFAFTQANGGSGRLSFVDTYSGTPGQSSFVYTLNMAIDVPLGGSAATIGLNDITFSTSANSTGTWSCGGPDILQTPGVTCPTATLAKAPEIDPASAASGLALLVGSLTVLRGRRRSS